VAHLPRYVEALKIELRLFEREAPPEDTGEHRIFTSIRRAIKNLEVAASDVRRYYSDREYFDSEIADWRKRQRRREDE
jgi:hypothetical protein